MCVRLFLSLALQWMDGWMSDGYIRARSRSHEASSTGRNPGDGDLLWRMFKFGDKWRAAGEEPAGTIKIRLNMAK